MQNVADAPAARAGACSKRRSRPSGVARVGHARRRGEYGPARAQGGGGARALLPCACTGGASRAACARAQVRTVAPISRFPRPIRARPRSALNRGSGASNDVESLRLGRNHASRHARARSMRRRLAVACSGSSTSSDREGGERPRRAGRERKASELAEQADSHAREPAAQRERLHREHTRELEAARARAPPRARPRSPGCAATSRTRRRRRAARLEAQAAPLQGGARASARRARARRSATSSPRCARASRCANRRSAASARSSTARLGSRRPLLGGSPHSASLARR